MIYTHTEENLTSVCVFVFGGTENALREETK